MAFSRACEIKDSEGTICVLKLVAYGEVLQRSKADPSCEGLANGGVTKECTSLLVQSKLDFKSSRGDSLMSQGDTDAMLSVLNACATGAPIPQSGGDDVELTPIDASVTLTGMSKDQFDSVKFSIAMARTMEVSVEDITDVKLVPRRRRSVVVLLRRLSI